MREDRATPLARTTTSSPRYGAAEDWPLAGEECLNATDQLALEIYRRKVKAFSKDRTTQDDPEYHAMEVILLLINAMNRDPPPPWMEGPKPQIKRAANTIGKRYLVRLREKKMANAEMLSLDRDETLVLIDMIDEDGDDVISLGEAVKRLKPSHREAITLKGEGYEDKNIAELTGNSIESVKSYVKVARQQLRKAMGKKRSDD